MEPYTTNCQNHKLGQTLTQTYLYAYMRYLIEFLKTLEVQRIFSSIAYIFTKTFCGSYTCVNRVIFGSKSANSTSVLPIVISIYFYEILCHLLPFIILIYKLCFFVIRFSPFYILVISINDMYLKHEYFALLKQNSFVID